MTTYFRCYKMQNPTSNYSPLTESLQLLSSNMKQSSQTIAIITFTATITSEDSWREQTYFHSARENTKGEHSKDSKTLFARNLKKARTLALSDIALTKQDAGQPPDRRHRA